MHQIFARARAQGTLLTLTEETADAMARLSKVPREDERAWRAYTLAICN
jgi:hypothetical protein